MREIDIVIYGATGFTGQLAAEYLTGGDSSLRVAIAGRNERKLLDVAKRCHKTPSIILADSSYPSSIDDMVKKARVVLSFAGPFSLYGEPVIAACARYGRDYLDITGETPFIRSMIERYHYEAQKNKARLVPFSGFDSVPADIAVFLAKESAAAQGCTLDEFTFFYKLKGGFNGGTLATALDMSERGVRRVLVDANSLIVGSQHRFRRSLVDYKFRYEPLMRRWTAPFLMSSVNEAVIRRSLWLESIAQPQKSLPAIRYQERLLVKNSWGMLRAAIATGALMGFGMLSAYKSGRKLLQTLGPKPGEGPSAQVRADGFFQGQLIARKRGESAYTKVSIERAGDPGNEITVALAAESARLAVENAFITDKAGFLTPSIAFGNLLVRRLIEAGFRITTENNLR